MRRSKGVWFALLLSLTAATASDAQDPLADLQQRASRGDPAARFELANRYMAGSGIEQDFVQALHWFTLAAQQGSASASAQYNLAVMYLNGQGVTQDNSEAVRWFRMAADNGDADSQFTLAVLLFNGQRGVEQNTSEAYKWFLLAGAAGNTSAAANAVLVQELLPASEVAARQTEARDWITRYNQRKSAAAAAATE